jgi:inosose dehydratase
MKIANAPISWGVFDETSDVPVQRFLDDLVACGYEGTELGPPGYLGDGVETRAELERRDLPLVGAFLGLPFHRAQRHDENANELRAALDILEVCVPDGSKPVVLLSESYLEPLRIATAGRADLVPDARLPEDGWNTLISGVAEAAEQCRQRGFSVAFHPHAATYIETEAEIERLFAALDGERIGFCLDTGHTFLGGSNPAQLIQRYGEVITHVHVKDVDPAVKQDLRAGRIDMEEAWRRGVFCELDEGEVDLATCLQELDAAGYDGWAVVEQDIVLDAKHDLDYAREAAIHSRNFLRRHGH